jgi:hypothetical protein
MLQRAAAAPPEMTAYRFGPPRHGGKVLHHPALSPGTAARPDFGAHPVAGDGERQEHGLAAPRGDPIALRAEPVHDQFGDLGFDSSFRSPLHRSEIG